MTLGRFRGTEVRIHWSWIFVLALIVVYFGGGLENGAGAWSAAAAWGTASVMALLVFLSVAAHELAHVYVASRYGLHAPAVVVQLLGGPYVMSVRPQDPRQELRVSAAGPLVSLVIAVVLLTAGGVGWSIGFAEDTAPIGIQAVELIAVWIGLVNLFLGAVNLIPGYPLDGARMFHAVAWRRSGVETMATHRAVRVGRYVGWAFILAGAGAMAFTDVPVGLALAVAGWLILMSSRVLDQRAFLQTLLTDLHVGEALDSNPVRVPPQLTLDVFAAQYLGDLLGAAALVARGSELLGMVGTAQIRRVPRGSWADTRTEQVMVPIDSVPRANADEELWPALETLEQSGLDALVVPQAEGEPALFSRRSAAKFVQEKAVEERRRMSARGGRGGSGGRGLFGR